MLEGDEKDELVVQRTRKCAKYIGNSVHHSGEEEEEEEKDDEEEEEEEVFVNVMWDERG